jgi:Macrocin-O-methyltransferase (TylF)
VHPISALRAARRGIARGLYAVVRSAAPVAYASDGLISVHAHAFVRDPGFVRAYARGVKAIGGIDTYQWHWRLHIGLWAATVAVRLEGDFVECGVNRGFLSSAIMEHLDWNSLDRDFYLLDTFAGIDERFVSDQERESGILLKNREKLQSGFYVKGVDQVRANFAQWPRARIIVGAVPETLSQVGAARVAFLHLDMNSAPPERAALSHFWDRLVTGAPVLLDDYAYFGCTEQRLAFDEFALARGVTICSLPTGQGLIIRPPRPSS